MKIITGGAVASMDPVLVEEGCPKDNLNEALVWMAIHYGDRIKQTKVTYSTFETVTLEVK
jgi:hypothetical protein